MLLSVATNKLNDGYDIKPFKYFGIALLVWYVYSFFACEWLDIHNHAGIGMIIFDAVINSLTIAFLVLTIKFCFQKFKNILVRLGIALFVWYPYSTYLDIHDPYFLAPLWVAIDILTFIYVSIILVIIYKSNLGADVHG